MKKSGLIVFFLFMIVSFTKGQVYNDILRLSRFDNKINARALGMGNAYIALSDDYSAVTFNPAGLGLIKRMEFETGLNLEYLNNESSLFNKKVEKDESDFVINQLGLVFPFPTFRGSIVASIGYNRVKNFNHVSKFDGYNYGSTSMIQDLTYFNDIIPYSLGLSYELLDDDGNYLYDETKINGNLNQSGEIKETGSIGSWNLAGAVEIARNLFVGATLNIYSGEYIKKRDYKEFDRYNNYGYDIELVPGDATTEDFRAFKLEDEINWDITGFDMEFGLLFQPNRMSRVGFTVKLPTFYKIEEKYQADATSTFGTNIGYRLDPPVRSELEYDVKTPFELSGGFAGNLSGIILSGQITYIDYTQMSFEDGLDESLMNQNNRDIDDFFRKTFNANFGAEYTIPVLNLRLRGGFIYKKSPFKDDPEEFDQKFVTTGFGFLADQTLSLDFTFVYGWWKNFADNYGYKESRVYHDISTTDFTFSMSYRF